MNQVKIGKFIAELRKEQNMTQKQLAERVGVSDKTISKWECGNGLPELCTIPELCRILGINMNELLSGERLAAENYSTKAEENMMILMKENHGAKKNSALITLLLSVLALTIATFFGTMYMFMDGGFFLLSLFDPATIVMLVVPTTLILLASGKGKAFGQAFPMLSDRKTYSEAERTQSVHAVRLVARSMFLLGLLTSVISFLSLFHSYSDSGMDISGLLKHMAVASLGILYGLIAYLFLLPIHERLRH